jgi:hypothetical protein
MADLGLQVSADLPFPVEAKLFVLWWDAQEKTQARAKESRR